MLNPSRPVKSKFPGLQGRVSPGKQSGGTTWNPLIILALVALVVLTSSLYVSERAIRYDKSSQVSPEQGVTGQQFNWRMVTSWPKNFPGLGMGPENFATIVEEMSAGRLKIHVYGAGELVPALGVLDAVSTGSVEMGHTAPYYHKGKMPASPFFTAIPFGMSVIEQNAWIHYGGGLELWRDLYKPFNLIPYAGGNTGVQMGGWFNREIHSSADLKGLKMRIPGIAGEVFTRAGGTAVAIPGGELYTAMQTGVIDATEWVGPYNDRSFGLHEVAQNYYYPGWHEPSAMLEFQVNVDALNQLPEDLQKIVEVAARAINADMLDEYVTRNAIALEELKTGFGIEPKPFPIDFMRELKKIADQYYEEEAAKDEHFARILKSHDDFKERSYNWLKVSEKAMYEYRDILER